MATHGRGLICAPISEQRCEELELNLMVGHNTALHETPFTVSVDLIGHGCTTGISASDRAKTIRALVIRLRNQVILADLDIFFRLKPEKRAFYAVPVIRRLW